MMLVWKTGFYKIFKSKSPQYYFKLIPKKCPHMLQEMLTILLFLSKHNFYKNSFFSSSIFEWNYLDPNLRNSENFGIFKTNILKFIRPKPKSFLNCCILHGIRLITRLRLELSHLREHKFKYFVVVVRVLNRPLIFFSTVLYLMIRDIPS